ncbi:MAG: type IV pilus assembly protein PilM [Planctomycetia bacterium]|nr:type IV pilus assembly protein PilM [Planctomycetia bacterium]
MVNWIGKTGYGPIGIELGSRAVKLVQFTVDQRKLVDAVRWDLPGSHEESSAEVRARALADALSRARQGRKFKGRDVVVCLGAHELFVQNIRVPKAPMAELYKLVQQEATARLPFPVAEAEVRFLCAGDVRQGEQMKREVILLACHRPALKQILSVVEKAGLRAVAVDIEPSALLRCYTKQFRREGDRGQRAMFVRLGPSTTSVVIAQDAEVFFVKYIDVGGQQFDDAVAAHLKISSDEAAALRRHNGDRRADQVDPDVARSVSEATRPVIERLASELSLCIRYYSVTFRGQALDRLVLGGSEAIQVLVDAIALRLDVQCELGDPLRSYESQPSGLRRGQWDVAAGLALRDFN